MILILENSLLMTIMVLVFQVSWVKIQNSVSGTSPFLSTKCWSSVPWSWNVHYSNQTVFVCCFVQEWGVISTISVWTVTCYLSNSSFIIQDSLEDADWGELLRYPCRNSLSDLWSNSEFSFESKSILRRIYTLIIIIGEQLHFYLFLMFSIEKMLMEMI